MNNNTNESMDTLDEIIDEPINEVSNSPIEFETTEVVAKQPSEEILSLEDKFIDNSVESTVVKTDYLKSSEIKAESSSMPHVLVDEALMSEIATIPDRFGFKIGDVADLLGIKQYVLRYWEQEFEILKPKKASNNQRLFTKKDVENAFLIRKLLYRDKFSIEGARQALKDVKFAFKKEKDFNSVVQKIDYIQLQLRGFAEDVRKAKALFS